MIAFLDKILGPRFVLWRTLVFLALIVWIIAALNGEFHGWDAKSGPSLLLIDFAIWSFLLLIPVGYIFEHLRAAVKLRYVGWLFALYIVGWVLSFAWFGWQLSVSIYEQSWKYFLQHNAGMVVFVSWIYAAPSIPLCLILLVARARGPVVRN